MRIYIELREHLSYIDVEDLPGDFSSIVGLPAQLIKIRNGNALRCNFQLQEESLSASRVKGNKVNPAFGTEALKLSLP